MTVDEAIVIKETPEPGYFAIPVRDRRTANNLSIAALKYRQEVKKAGYIDLDDLLPGETKD